MILKKYSNRLKSCPLCNGKAEVEEGDLFFSTAVWVECQICGLRAKAQTAELEFSAVEKVIEQWNKRAGDCL